MTLNNLARVLLLSVLIVGSLTNKALADSFHIRIHNSEDTYDYIKVDDSLTLTIKGDYLLLNNEEDTNIYSLDNVKGFSYVIVSDVEEITKEGVTVHLSSREIKLSSVSESPQTYFIYNEGGTLIDNNSFSGSKSIWLENYTAGIYILTITGGKSIKFIVK